MTGLLLMLIAFLLWCLYDELHPKVNQYYRLDLIILDIFLIIVCILALFLINR